MEGSSSHEPRPELRTTERWSSSKSRSAVDSSRKKADPIETNKGNIPTSPEASTSQKDGPSLPESLDSLDTSIPPAQKPRNKPADSPFTSASWRAPQKRPEDFERNRVKKNIYTQYFNCNTILPILELTKEFEPRKDSFVVSDNKTRRLTSLRREAFEEVFRAARVPCKYFCRRSFATWNILQPTAEQAAKLAGGNLMNYKLQLEYMGTRRIRVTVCNVPIDLSGDMLAAFLSSYGKEKDVSQIITSSDLIHGNYVFKICLKRDGFQAIPNTINYKDGPLMVVVEGRRPHF